jgi:hypothetical protein
LTSDLVNASLVNKKTTITSTSTYRRFYERVENLLELHKNRVIVIMEPVSILASVSAASGAALALSTALFTFVQATRNVDQSVRSLYDEVTGLNRTLDAISSCLENARIQESVHTEQNKKLWKSVTASLGGCRVTVDSLCQTLQGVKKPGSNVATQTLRTFKLNWKEDHIRNLRSQIQSHNTALQLALQMINV